MENTNTNNESLKGVRILRSYYEALDEFTYEEKGYMFEAIMEYGLNGVEPTFEGATDARALRGIWKTYLPVINNSITRAIASSKNGNKGGAPKKSNEVTTIASTTQTENKAPEATISTQAIPVAQIEEKVSEIEANDLEIDVMSLFGDATRIDGKIDDILFDELLTFIEILKNKVIDFNSVTLKYSVIKKLKNLIDNSNISDELKNNLNNCIDNFDPSTYEKSKMQLMLKN